MVGLRSLMSCNQDGKWGKKKASKENTKRWQVGLKNNLKLDLGRKFHILGGSLPWLLASSLPLPTGLLMTRQLASLRPERARLRQDHIIFYHLSLEDTCHLFHFILLIRSELVSLAHTQREAN